MHIDDKAALRSPLKKALGLGSTHSGAQVWISERITAIALIPLTLWFVYQAVRLCHADYATCAAFVASPLNAILLILLAVLMIQHAVMGLRVVIEDYVHSEGAKISLLLAVKFTGWGLIATSIFAICRIAFTA
jgi:succinate dehydrogenase / fumarate reductase membrane anchor subunit